MTEQQISALAAEFGLPYIGWHPVRRVGDWVQMRSGAGESGWWHIHEDEADYGANPGDREDAAIRCRTCRADKP